jgi:hypothetical protein
MAQPEEVVKPLTFVVSCIKIDDHQIDEIEQRLRDYPGVARVGRGSFYTDLVVELVQGADAEAIRSQAQHVYQSVAGGATVR